MSAALDDDAFEAAHATERAKRRKALWIMAGIIAAMLGLIAFAFIQDEAPPDTSDLRVVFKKPPEDQNAYALLAKLVATLPPAPDDNTPEERHFSSIFSPDAEEQVAWNQAIVASVLARYPADLADQVRATLAAPECEAPEIKSYNDSIPEVGRFRQLALTLTQQAALAWHAGDHSTATDLNLLVLHLGQRINQSQGPLITVLTGTAIQGIALGSIRLHVDAATITPDDLRRYFAQIPLHEIQIGDYHTAYKVEHTGFFVSVAHAIRTESMSTLSGGKPNKALDLVLTLPGVYQPNRTTRWHAEFIRAHIASSDPLPPGAVDQAAAQIESLIQAPWHRRLQNFSGRVLLAITVPTLGKVTTTAHRVRANLRLTQLYVALRLYQLEHDNALPADLAELVPAYLPAIPLDPYGGQPLRYDRTLTTIWSIDQKHLTITSADGDFPERGMPAHRLRFARPPVELPVFTEEPEPASDTPPDPALLPVEEPKEQE